MSENRTFGNVVRPAQPTAGPPWFFFLFITTVFLFAQHDWYFSLLGVDDFIKSLNDLTDSLDQGNLLRRIAFLLLGVFSAVSLLWPRFRRFRVGGSLGWLVLFLLAWAFLSFTWADDQSLAARRLAVLAATCLGAFVASRRFSPRDTNLWVLLSTFLYLNLGIAAEIILGTFHPLSGGYRFAGTLHPNVQGMNCALLFIATVFMLRGGKRSPYLLYAVAAEALTFLILTKSRTSFVFALSAPLLCYFLASKVSRKGVAVLVTVSVVCLLALLGDLVLPTLQQGILLGRGFSEVDTLTGRVPIWQQALPYISRRLIEGYGYDAFWTARHMDDFWTQQHWAVPNAHSAYIECALGLGIVGVGLFVATVITATGRALTAYKHSRNPGFGFIASILIFAALDGLLESAVIQPSHITFACMLAFATLGFPVRSGRGSDGARTGDLGAEPYDRSAMGQNTHEVSR